MARTGRASREDAQLCRHHRVPAQRSRRDVAAGPRARRRAGAGKTGEPGWARARSDSQRRRSTLLFSRRQDHPDRATDFSQCVSRRSRRSSSATWRSTTTRAWSVSERVAGRWTQVMVVRAQGRPPLWPQVLGRCEHGPSAQGAPGRRPRRGRRAICVHRRGRQRQDRPRDGQAVVGGSAAGLAGASRARSARCRPMKRAGPSARCPADSRRSWKAIARCAASANRSCISSIPTAWWRSAYSSSRLPRRRCRPAVSQQGGLNVYIDQER